MRLILGKRSLQSALRRLQVHKVQRARFCESRNRHDYYYNFVPTREQRRRLACQRIRTAIEVLISPSSHHGSCIDRIVYCSGVVKKSSRTERLSSFSSRKWNSNRSCTLKCTRAFSRNGISFQAVTDGSKICSLCACGFQGKFPGYVLSSLDPDSSRQILTAECAYLPSRIMI